MSRKKRASSQRNRHTGRTNAATQRIIDQKHFAPDARGRLYAAGYSNPFSPGITVVRVR